MTYLDKTKYNYNYYFALHKFFLNTFFRFFIDANINIRSAYEIIGFHFIIIYLYKYIITSENNFLYFFNCIYILFLPFTLYLIISYNICDINYYNTKFFYHDMNLSIYKKFYYYYNNCTNIICIVYTFSYSLNTLLINNYEITMFIVKLFCLIITINRYIGEYFIIKETHVYKYKYIQYRNLIYIFIYLSTFLGSYIPSNNNNNNNISDILWLICNVLNTIFYTNNRNFI